MRGGNRLKRIMLGSACIALAHVGVAEAQPAADARPEARNARHGSVTIKRDDYGIPNIYADDTYSLFYGWGYAVAEDRLFQIEAIRRTALGRTAEVFGPDHVEYDRAALTNYDPAVLRPQIAALKGEHRDVLDGMAAGINARIREVLADRDRLLPKQFKDHGFLPEQWSDLDIVMVWLGQTLLRFSDYTAQISNKVLLADLAKMHGAEKAEAIFRTLRWNDDSAAPLTIQPADAERGAKLAGASPTPLAPSPISEKAGAAEARLTTVLWGGSGPQHTPHSSNVWVLGKSRLIDADAVMVNGPQVGDFVPSMIWGASLHGAGLDVTGTTYPGLPYFHFGTNGDIAWGRTALAGSVIDMFEEELNPANLREYRYKGRWRPMTRRTVRVLVKGGEPVDLELYSTVHGPVITFDDENRIAYSKRRSWSGHEVETMFAYFDEMKARDFSQWAKAIAGKSNNQNQYYADKDGNIAYVQAGRYPIRARDFDIHLPTPGTGDREWAGFQPTTGNVRALNPGQGYIANWNNRPAAAVLNTDTLLWSKVDRNHAITTEIEARPALTVQQAWDINQRTSYSAEQHVFFVPLVKAAAASLPADSGARQVADAITGWNGQEEDPTHSGYYASPGMTAYYSWMEKALTRFFARDIPEKYLGGCEDTLSALNCGAGWQQLGPQILHFALSRSTTRTPPIAHDFLHGKDPGDFIRETLAETATALRSTYGEKPGQWLTRTKPKVWKNGPEGGARWAAPGEQISRGPDQKRGTMNALYVFRNGKVAMCDVAPPGQSGFVAPDGTPDPHYRDQLDIYVSFGCKPRHIEKQQVDANTRSEKILRF